MIIENYLHLIIFLCLVIFVLVIFAWNNLRSARNLEKLSKKVVEAEVDAFEKKNKPKFLRNTQPSASKEGFALDEALDLDGDLNLNDLFKLYSRQIESYQEQTRSRASSSFMFAIIAMFAGIIFIFWGFSYMVNNPSLDASLAGSAISTIGGAISAYITKTFLAVHQLSIQQLNRYFRQPVINDHIVMAQRLADQLEDPLAKKQAYEAIINQVVSLIAAEDSQSSADS